MQGGSQYILIGILLLSRESRQSLVGFQSEFQYILPGFIRDPASFSWNPGICQSNSQWDPCIFSRDPASFSGNPGTFQSKSCHIPVYFDRDIYWDPASWPGFLKFYPSGIYWDSDWNPTGIPDSFSLGYICKYQQFWEKEFTWLKKKRYW